MNGEPPEALAAEDCPADATDFSFVESLLSTAGELTQRLAVVLEQERDALVQRDMTALHTVIAEKDQIIGMLARVERSRDAMVEDALRQPHFSLQQRERLTTLQHDIRRQISACRDQNQVNGRLVQRARHSVAEILQVITGNDRAETYTANGSPDAPAGGRSIGKA